MAEKSCADKQVACTRIWEGDASVNHQPRIYGDLRDRPLGMSAGDHLDCILIDVGRPILIVGGAVPYPGILHKTEKASHVLCVDSLLSVVCGCFCEL